MGQDRVSAEERKRKIRKSEKLHVSVADSCWHENQAFDQPNVLIDEVHFKPLPLSTLLAF